MTVTIYKLCVDGDMENTRSSSLFRITNTSFRSSIHPIQHNINKIKRSHTTHKKYLILHAETSGPQLWHHSK